MIRRLLSWLFEMSLYAVMLVLIYLLLFADNGIRFYMQVNRLKSEQHAELLLLQKRQLLYEKHTKLLREDQEYFDKEVRSVWSMVKPNEIVMDKKDLGVEVIKEDGDEHYEY